MLRKGTKVICCFLFRSLLSIFCRNVCQKIFKYGLFGYSIKLLFCEQSCILKYSFAQEQPIYLKLFFIK